MRTSQRAWLVVAVLALAAPAVAGAAPRLAIAPVKDDPGPIAAQLHRALCADRECLRGAASGPMLDLARARRLGAAGTLAASVWKERRGRVLSASLFTSTAKPVKSWVLPLDRSGRLPQAALDTLVADVAAFLPPAPAKAPKAERPAPPPAASPAPLKAAEPAAATEAETKSVAEAEAAPARPIAPVSPEAAAPRPSVASPRPPASPAARSAGPTQAPRLPPMPRVIVEVGVAPNHRELRYQETGTTPVPLGVKVDQPALPRLRIEVRPLDSSGATVFADAAYGNGIDLAAGTRQHHATASRLEAGVLWRLPLSRSLSVAPSLALHRETFEVAAADGVALTGFPDQALLGVRAGVVADLRLERTRFGVCAALGGTWWLQAGELIGGEGFFPGGNAYGLDAELGLSVDVWGPLSVRLLGDYALTRWSLEPDATTPYRSRWARQELLGGRLMLRASF